jgi:hypothetical protein
MRTNFYGRKFAALMILGTILLGVRGEIYSGSVSGQLFIRAEVLPIVEYGIATEPSVLEIKIPDLVKGFAHINNDVIHYVKTNNTNGYYISINAADMEFIASITVNIDTYYFSVNTEDKDFIPVVTVKKAGENVAELYPGQSVQVYMPYQLSEEKLKLSFRFHLSEDTESGVYPWPITVTIYPA